MSPETLPLLAVYLPVSVLPVNLFQCRSALALFLGRAVYTGFNEVGIYLEVPDDEKCLDIIREFFPEAKEVAN